MIKKIAILTSGGDAPGMNSAVKAVVNASFRKGLIPILVYEGYKGLTEGNFKEATHADMAGIQSKGGTVLYSARFPEFKKEEIRIKAKEQLEKQGIDALVVIGGDGTYKGASLLSKLGIKTIGLPGTIDNDISSTDLTIGFSTAKRTIVTAIEAVKDTHKSHNRAGIIEVMGREDGSLAIDAAIATSAEILSVPERKLTEEQIISEVKKYRENGKRDITVIVTEQMYDVYTLATKVEQNTGVETRATILGHIQRGGTPTPADRTLAISMGAFAVDRLLDGETDVAVNITHGDLTTMPIEEVVNMKRTSKDKLLRNYDLTK